VSPATTEGRERPICDYEGSTYRTDFWEGQGREYEDLAERAALRALLPPEGGRLLDIGAGFGRLAALYGGYRQVVLLDYSFSQLQYARQRLGDEGFVYVAADIYRLPLGTHTVDTTVMVRVLHHLVDVPLAFRQIGRVTRPGGTFVLEFANKRHLKNLVRHLLGRGVNPFAPEPYAFASLHYDYHPDWIRQRLGAEGLEAEEARSVSFFRLGALKRAVSPGALARLDAALQRPLAPLAVAPSHFYRCRVATTGDAKAASGELAFRCPSCDHEPLERVAAGWTCGRCAAHWPIIDGIHVFKDVAAVDAVAGNG
jgi:ubiquinone/menaquinone biosynthesis C-methylase UbiE